MPPEVAAFLGVPHLTNVVDRGRRGPLAVRETDDGRRVYELRCPRCLSVALRADEARVDDGRSRRGRRPTWSTTSGRTTSASARPARRRACWRSRRDARACAAPSIGRRRSRAPRSRSCSRSGRAPEAPGTSRSASAEQPGRNYDCWTLVELDRGRPTRHSLELLGQGRELAGNLGGRNVALVAGHGLEDARREATRRGAEGVVRPTTSGSPAYQPERGHAAVQRSSSRSARTRCSSRPRAAGRDLGPRVAGDLELGMTGDCVTSGSTKAGRLIQFKPAYGGNIVIVIMGATTPQLATVRARMFEPLEPHDDAASGDTSFAHRAAAPFRATPGRRAPRRPDRSRARRADVVVFGAGAGRRGRGLGLHPARRSAAPHPDLAPAAAARALGRPVAPRLYSDRAGGDFEHSPPG